MSQRPTERPEGPPGPSGPQPQPRRDAGRPSPLPRYQLILAGTAVTDMTLVIHTIMELTHLGRAEATHRMWQAYYGGRSQILVTYKERAELYVEQFAEKGIPVTIEPV